MVQGGSNMNKVFLMTPSKATVSISSPQIGLTPTTPTM